MAFNLGAALGSAVTTGVKTYTTLQEEERLQAAEKRLQEQFDIQRKEQTKKEAAEQAYLNTVGNSSELRDQAISGTEGVGTAGPTIQREVTAYTPEQKQQDLQSQLRATGANPLYAMQLQSAGLGIKGLQRTEKRAEAEDAFSQWQEKSVAELSKDPVAYLESNLGAYNNAKKGSHLDDGYKAEIKKGADGSSSIVRTDSKGKVIDTTPITAQTAMMAFKEIAFDKYTSLPGKFREGVELGFQKEGVALKGREVGAKEREVDLKAELLPSEKAKNFASAFASNQAGGYYGAHAKTIGDENSRKQAIFDLQQTFSNEIQQLDPKSSTYQTDKFNLAQKAEAAIAMKSGDFSRIAANTDMGRAISDYSNAQKAFVEGKSGTEPNQNEYLMKYGYAPEAVTAIKQKEIETLVANGKIKEANQKVNEYNSRYKNSPPLKPQGAVTALPINDNAPVAPAAKPMSAINPAVTPAGTDLSKSQWAQNVQANQLAQLKKDFESSKNPRDKIRIGNQIKQIEAQNQPQ